MKNTKKMNATIQQRSVIADKLLAWYDVNGRELLWRKDTTLYRVWVSEIMLQQTRVEAVEPYFKRFIARFPDMQTLAEAPEEEVLHAWQGLGYYSRARNLKTGVSEALSRHGGELPRTRLEVESLTGIGSYTAGALLSIVHGQAEPAVDANVLRVFSRLFCLKQSISSTAGRNLVFSLVREMMPVDRPGDFNQAIMDLGSSICGKVPRCADCPLATECIAHYEGRQNHLPLKTKKPQPKPVAMVVGVMTNNDKCYLRKRPNGGLLGGMWEFPTDELIGEPVAALQLLFPNCGQPVDWVYWRSLQHVFSHRVWDLQIYRGVGTAPAKMSGCWFSQEEMNAIPLGKPHRIIADWLCDQILF